MKTNHCPRCDKPVPQKYPVHLSCWFARVRVWVISLAMFIFLLPIVLLNIDVNSLLANTEPLPIPTTLPIPTFAVIAVVPTQTPRQTIPVTATPAPTKTPTATTTPTKTLTLTVISTPIPTKTPTPAPTPTGTPSSKPDLPSVRALGKVVFQSNRDGDFEIYIINVDGTNLRQLTNNSIDDKYPVVSPDGQHIAYQVKSGSDEQWEIYVMDIDGRNSTRITNTGGWNRLPTWSPDGSQIAFLSNRTGQFALHIMNADGQNPRRVGTTQGREGNSSWSVNEQIAFSTGGNTSNFWRIVVLNTDGGGVQTLTENGNWSPEWSPDGRSIVFVSTRQGGSQDAGIYLMNADGSNQRPLYDSPNYEWGAVWSGDGQSVLFTIDVSSNQSNIYFIPVTGGTPTLITESGQYPSWVNGR